MGNPAAEHDFLSQAFSIVSCCSSEIKWEELYSILQSFESAGEISSVATLLNQSPEQVSQAPVLQIVQERVRIAIEHRTRMSSAARVIAPLGQDCIASAIAMRWGFGTSLLTGPFHAGTFPGNGPAIAIEDRFQAFLNPRMHKLSTSPSGFDILTIPKYRTYLNHEVGPYWINGSTERIVQLYRERIDTLMEKLRGRPILFVFAQKSAADVERLVVALDGLMGDSDFRLLVVDWSQDGAFTRDFADQRIAMVTSPKPGANYTWHVPEAFNTDEGLDFEAPIAAAMVSASEFRT